MNPPTCPKWCIRAREHPLGSAYLVHLGKAAQVVEGHLDATVHIGRSDAFHAGRWVTVEKTAITVTGWEPSERSGPAQDSTVTDLTTGQARGLAWLLDQLGHATLAAAIRQAITLIETEESP